jgi:hypothetical protein
MSAEQIVVESRFNGPRESGNGGYAAGLFAGLVDGTAEISLRSPVPLDTPLEATHAGGLVEVRDGETLVAEVRETSASPAGPPARVSIEQAREASAGYRGQTGGPFSSCFVCGLDRDDTFGVFAGAVDGTSMVASPWTPPDWAKGDDGAVRPEFVWATLDCPTYFALYTDSNPMSFLVRVSARIDAPVTAGVEHVVVAWPIRKDGKKHSAGSAVLDTDGNPLAVSEALLIDTTKTGD